MLAAARAALAHSERDLDFQRLDAEAFGRAPSISLDHAVMERTDKAAVIPLDCGWSDIGSWSALWEVDGKDADGNALVGNVAAEGSTGRYLRGEGPLVVAVGIKDLIVVATDDVVLVAPKDRAQDVKGMVERLKREGRSTAVASRRVHRPCTGSW